MVFFVESIKRCFLKVFWIPSDRAVFDYFFEVLSLSWGLVFMTNCGRLSFSIGLLHVFLSTSTSKFPLLIFFVRMFALLEAIFSIKKRNSMAIKVLVIRLQYNLGILLLFHFLNRIHRGFTWCFCLYWAYVLFLFACLVLHHSAGVIILLRIYERSISTRLSCIGVTSDSILVSGGTFWTSDNFKLLALKVKLWSKSCFADPPPPPSSTFDIRKVWCLFSIRSIRRKRSGFNHIVARVWADQLIDHIGHLRWIV